jgi:hypothetical protein
MILVAAPRASAFVVNCISKHSTTTGSYHYDCYSCCCQSEYQSRLYGIEQWRDLPETIWNDSDEDDVIQVRTVPILTRESQNLLLQGQTLHLPLTEADDIRVFQRAMQDNERIFGMGLLEYHDHDEDDDVYDDDDDDDDENHGETTTTFLQTIPLLEIQDYKLETRDRSYCIAKVVGRAGVHKILQETEDPHKSNSYNQQPIAVLCTETFDTFQESNLEKANTLASLIENLIADTSDIEESYRRHRSKRRAGDDESSWRNQDHRHPPRHDDGSTRMRRYQAAYQSALENDSQGYLLPPGAMSSSSSSTSTSTSSSLSVPVAAAAAATSRSWQELTAISWAAFASGACLADDSTFRLSALDMDCVSNRLQLAVYWLSDVRFEVEQQVR